MEMNMVKVKKVSVHMQTQLQDKKQQTEKEYKLLKVLLMQPQANIREMTR